MTNSSLLQSVIELALIYLVQSVLFLGGVACALLVVNWSRRHRSDASGRAISPAIEERLWKLAAVLPFLTVPLTIFAGWSCAIPNWSPQPTAIVAADDESADIDVVILNDQQPNAVRDEPIVSEPPFIETSDVPAMGDSGAVPEPSEEPFIVHHEVPTPTSKSITESRPVSTPSTNTPKVLATPEPVLTNEPAKSWQWHTWLGQAFACVIAWSLIRLVVRGFLVHRFLKQCSPADAGLRETLDRLTTHGRSIRLLRAPRENVAEPFACGLWRWTIVLPDGIENQLKPAEMRALLAHEVAHLVRRDPLWLFIGEFLCTGFAIQPLNILARRRWLQAAELLCDDWAVEHSVSATTLATCLARIAELRLNRHSRTWGLAAIGRSGLLTRRVEWLLRTSRTPESKTRHSSFRVTVVVFTAAVLVGTLGPRFVLETPVEAAIETDAELDRVAIEKELSLALDELQQTESLLIHDSDPKVVTAAARLRARVQFIRESLRD